MWEVHGLPGLRFRMSWGLLTLSLILLSESIAEEGSPVVLVDAIGATVTHSSYIERPLSVGSQVDLLKPDRYEFYTFDETGDLVKRLMTLAEIQEIVASGDEGGVAIIPSDPSFNTDPTSPTEEPALDAVVSSVQDVLQSQLQQFQNQPQSDSFSSLDTPDVSQHWSHILPAVFGEPSDTEIITEQNAAESTTVKDVISTAAETTNAHLTSTIQPFTDKTIPPTVITTSKLLTTNTIISSSNRPLTTTEKSVIYVPFSKRPSTAAENLHVIKNDVPTFDMSESMNQIAIGLGDKPSVTEVINESTVTTQPSTIQSTVYTTERIITAKPTTTKKNILTTKKPQTVVNKNNFSSTPFYRPVEIEANELSESVSNLLSQISQDPLDAIANIDAIDKISLKSDINRYDISNTLSKRKDDDIFLKLSEVDEKISQKEGEALLIETTTINTSLLSSTLKSKNISAIIRTELQNESVKTTALPLSTGNVKFENSSSEEIVNYIKLPLLTTPKPKIAEVKLNIIKNISKLSDINSNKSEHILINSNKTNENLSNSTILIEPNTPINVNKTIIKQEDNQKNILQNKLNITANKNKIFNDSIKIDNKINETNFELKDNIKKLPQLPHSNLEIEKLKNSTKKNDESHINSLEASTNTADSVYQTTTKIFTDGISEPTSVQNITTKDTEQSLFLNTVNSTEKYNVLFRNNSQYSYKNNSLINSVSNFTNTGKLEKDNPSYNETVLMLNNTYENYQKKTNAIQENSTFLITTFAPETTTFTNIHIKTTNIPSKINTLKIDDNIPQINKTKIHKFEINNNEINNQYDDRNNIWKLVSTVKPNLTEKNVTHMQLAGVTSSKPLTAQRPKPAADKTSNKFVDLEDVPQENQGLEATTKNLNEDIYQFAELCNELAFRYWNAVVTEGIDEKRSVVVSPFAITSLLAMIFMGARGSTSGEMNEILKLDDMVTFNPHFIMKNVTESIEQARSSGVATSAFVRELYSDRNKGKILGFFKDRAQQFYGAHVEEINFKLVSDVIRRRTNLLVKRHTWGKIPEYIKSNNIALKAPLAAFSANIFQTECSGVSTSGRDAEMYFAVSPSVRQRRLVPVPAAVERRAFLAGYEPGLDATVAALSPESSVSLILAMPGQLGRASGHDGDTDDALSGLSKELTQAPLAWKRLLRAMAPRPGLELQFPRFQHRSAIDSGAALRRMGLKELFDSERADLRGLSSTGRSINELFLADILEVTTVGTCSETGVGGPGDSRHSEVYPVEAGASSSRRRRALYRELPPLPLHLRPRQARRPLPESPPANAPRLRFDRPFLYFVRHNPTGLILYVGRYNPRLLP